MNEETKKDRIIRVGRVFSVVTAVLCVLVGIAYIAAAYHIYLTGGADPYTRERVGEYLLWLLPASLLLVLSVIASAVLGADGEKLSVYNDASYLLMRAKKKNPTSTLDEPTQRIALAEQKKRRIYFIISAIAVVLLLGAALILALDKSQYQNENLTKEVLGAVIKILPLAAAALAIVTYLSYLAKKSARVELDAHMLAVKEGRVGESTEAATAKKRTGLVIALRVTVATLALALVIYGALSGGMNDVFSKAVKICTECIGLG
ncbi:MAG: hypothetical protein IJW03_03325 [Clostridia bacterium]|nr:hypothetical protein [Clostridia bacterium]